MRLTERIRSLTPFHRWLLLISAGLAVTGGVLAYTSSSAAQAARAAAARLQDAQNQMQLLQRKLSRPVPAPDLTLPARAIPNNWEMARFFADLTTAANTWSIHIASVTPNPPSPDPGGFKPPGTPGSAGATTPTSPGGSSANPAGAQGGGNQPSGSPSQATGGGAGSPSPSAPSSPGSVGATPGTATNGSAPGAASGPAAPTSGSAGATTGKEAVPPAALPGIHSLTIAITAEGTGSNLLAFLDELTAMPRLVWITDYTLDFSGGGSNPGGAAGGAGGGAGTSTGTARLQLTLTLYSHAPWDSRAVAETPWPFPIQPAGNPEAFGR